MYLLIKIYPVWGIFFNLIFQYFYEEFHFRKSKPLAWQDAENLHLCKWPVSCIWAIWKVKVSVVQSCLDFVTSWTVALQGPLSMELSRQGYRSGVPFPSPRDLPNPGIKPRSSALQADSLPSEPLGFLVAQYSILTI